MKFLEKQQESSPFQSQLDEYLALKPNRAVERLLQENNLSQCFEIYNLLQENVKENTSQLRKVLYSKHENLHQCSYMILQIQDFAEKVKDIQHNIDDLLKTQVIQQEWDNLDRNYSDNNPVAKIQDLMNNNKFTEALKECVRYLTNNEREQVWQQSQIYYINFLKVEVIQKLQEYLENTLLTSELIQQSIHALKEFMLISPVQDLFEYNQESIPSQSQPILNVNDDSKTLLGLIYEKYEEKQDGERKYPLQQAEIVEVIFKFKLLTLKKSTKKDFHAFGQSQEDRVQFLYSKVFHYFSDLLKILEQVSSKQNRNQIFNKQSNHSKLHQIFSNNIQKTIQQISEIFISDKTNQNHDFQSSLRKQQQNLTTLTFENELYEKLISSQEFIEVLTSLERHFAKEDSMQNQHKNYEILGLIKNLWKDFYHQMLDIITQKINPCAYLKIQEFLKTQPLVQFERFSVINFQKVTKQKLQDYEKELYIFFSNFLELLNKSKSSKEKNSIIQYFLQLKIKIENQSRQKIIKLNQQPNKIHKLNQNHSSIKQLQLQVRSIFILYFLTQSYNNSWVSTFENNSDLSKLLIDCNFKTSKQQVFQILIFSNENHPQSLFSQCYSIIDRYINTSISYLQLSGSQQIQRWQLQFDKIFGSYTNVVKESETLKRDYKQLILALIKTKLQHLQKE